MILPLAAASGAVPYEAASLWGVLLRLAIALAVLLPAAYYVTRFYARKASNWGRGGALQVVESVALGPHRSIHLLALGDRMLVLGATSERITVLASIQDPKEVEALRNLRGEPASADFVDVLKGAVKRWKPTLDEEDRS